MTKKDVLEMDGEIIEKLPAGVIKVVLENDAELRCKKAGKMKKNNVSLLPGDKVKIEISMYDPSQWRIIYRYNNKLRD